MNVAVFFFILTVGCGSGGNFCIYCNPFFLCVKTSSYCIQGYMSVLMCNGVKGKAVPV